MLTKYVKIKNTSIEARISMVKGRHAKQVPIFRYEQWGDFPYPIDQRMGCMHARESQDRIF